MIIPRSAGTMTDAVRMGSDVLGLRDILKNAGLAVTVGDEGGYAPQLLMVNEPLNFIKRRWSELDIASGGCSFGTGCSGVRVLDGWKL